MGESAQMWRKQCKQHLTVVQEVTPDRARQGQVSARSLEDERNRRKKKKDNDTQTRESNATPAGAASNDNRHTSARPARRRRDQWLLLCELKRSL